MSADEDNGMAEPAGGGLASVERSVVLCIWQEQASCRYINCGSSKYQSNNLVLLCESRNQEQFDIHSKTVNHKLKVIHSYSLQFFHITSDWLFPRNTVTFQK